MPAPEAVSTGPPAPLAGRPSVPVPPDARSDEDCAAVPRQPSGSIRTDVRARPGLAPGAAGRPVLSTVLAQGHADDPGTGPCAPGARFRPARDAGDEINIWPTHRPKA